MIPGTAEILRPPGSISFESSTSKHDRAGAYFMDTGGITHNYSAHPALTILHKADSGGPVADLNIFFLGNRKPHPRKAHPLICRPHDGAFGPFDHATDLDRAEADGRFESDSLLGHPAGRIVGV